MSHPLCRPWARIHKGDMRARLLADDHYTRQHKGHPMWTRPGYNFALFAEYAKGSAVFCWWRPKWEDGRSGTQRKDNLRVLECTIFRRVGITDLASNLIKSAVASLNTLDACHDLHLTEAGIIDTVITGVSSSKTKRGRSKNSLPGKCFRDAGFCELNKRAGKADIWLKHPWENPFRER